MEQQEEVLTPSYHGELCRHNGDNPDYEIACDECDYNLACFPDWKEMIDMGSPLMDWFTAALSRNPQRSI